MKKKNFWIVGAGVIALAVVVGVAMRASSVEAQDCLAFPEAPGCVAPTVTLTASPSIIFAGATTTLTWSSQNANVMVHSNFDAPTTTMSGSMVISPSMTRDYIIEFRNFRNPQIASADVTVTVIGNTPIPAQPPIRFSFGQVSASGTILNGSRDTSGNYDFTVAHGSTGFYDIAFNSGVFSAVPTVVANPVGASARLAPTIQTVVPSSNGYLAPVEFGTSNSGVTGVLTDTGFSFIAVGETNNPRSDLSIIFGGFDASGNKTISGSDDTPGGYWFGGGSGNGTYNLIFDNSAFSDTPTLVANENGEVDCVSNSGTSQYGATISNNHTNCKNTQNGSPITFLVVGKSQNVSNLANFRIAVGNILSGSFQSGTNDLSTSPWESGSGYARYEISFKVPGIFAAPPVVISNPFGVTADNYCAGANTFSLLGFDVYVSGKSDGTMCQLAADSPVGVGVIAVGRAGVTCLPTTQTVNAGSAAPMSATGGNLTYSWSAPGGTPASGTGATFSPTYSTAGNYSATVTSANNVSATCKVTVVGSASPTNNGTVTVSSTNAVTGGSVTSSWDLVGPTTTYSYATQYATSAVYTGLPTQYNTIPLVPYTVSPVQNSAGPLYTLRTVNEETVAENAKGNLLGHLFSISENALTSIAYAQIVCDPSNYPCSGGNSTPTQSLTPTSTTANFIILWDPIAAINVSSTPSGMLQLSTPSNTSGQISITNSGAQGSTLNNLTYTISPSSASSWLSISSLSGISLGQGNSANVTITGSSTSAPSSCSSGCTATVTFSANSLPTNDTVTPVPLNVTFTVTPSTPSAPTSSLSITVNSTQPTAEGVPVQVTASGGTGSYTWSTPSGTPTGSGSTIQIVYPKQGSYPVTCTDSDGNSTTTTVLITTACTLSASPASVVPPEASTLTWSCAPQTAASCSINGQSVCNSVSSCNTGGTLSESPTQNATYALLCTANNGITPPSTMSSIVTVTVQGPGVHEVNP